MIHLLDYLFSWNLMMKMYACVRHDYGWKGRMPLFILSLGRYGVRQSYSLEAAGMTTGVSDNVGERRCGVRIRPPLFCFPYIDNFPEQRVSSCVLTQYFNSRSRPCLKARSATLPILVFSLIESPRSHQFSLELL